MSTRVSLLRFDGTLAGASASTSFTDKGVIVVIIVVVLIFLFFILFVKRVPILCAISDVIREHVPVHRLLYSLVVCHLCQPPLVDGFTGLFLLHDAKDAIIEMLVEVLSVVEGGRACRALAGGIRRIARDLFR